MTDNEIIKALECCLPQNGKRNCDDCPYAECEKGCADKLTKDCLDLINRQNAEIEKLKTQLGKSENFFTIKLDKEQLNDIVKSQIEKFEVDAVTVRNEAIREFVKQHKEIMREYLYNDSTDFLMKWCEYETATDNLIKTMTEGTNNE